MPEGPELEEGKHHRRRTSRRAELTGWEDYQPVIPPVSSHLGPDLSFRTTVPLEIPPFPTNVPRRPYPVHRVYGPYPGRRINDYNPN